MAYLEGVHSLVELIVVYFYELVGSLKRLERTTLVVVQLLTNKTFILLESSVSKDKIKCTFFGKYLFSESAYLRSRQQYCSTNSLSEKKITIFKVSRNSFLKMKVSILCFVKLLCKLSVVLVLPFVLSTSKHTRYQCQFESVA